MELVVLDGIGSGRWNPIGQWRKESERRQCMGNFLIGEMKTVARRMGKSVPAISNRVVEGDGEWSS